MLVNQLYLGAAAQQQRKIIEAGDIALQLDAVGQEDRHRYLFFAQGVEEHVLDILRFFSHSHLLTCDWYKF